MRSYLVLIVAIFGLFAPCRAAHAQKLVRDYEFSVSTADAAKRGPNLLPTGTPPNELAGHGYAFPAGQGLALEDTGVSDHYTLELVFRLDQVDGYRKLVDFKGRTSDNGLYVLDGALKFYDVAEGGAIQAGQECHVVLDRDRATKLVRASVDGQEAFHFTDDSDDAVFDHRGAAFFIDDTVTSGEESGGVVSRLRLWDAPGGQGAAVHAVESGVADVGRRLVRDYAFSANVPNAAGDGPALQPVDAGADAGQLRFAAGKGFFLPDAGVSDDYAIEMTVSLDTVDGYRKLIDFKRRSQDEGVYVYNGALVFYGSTAEEQDILRSARTRELIDDFGEILKPAASRNEPGGARAAMEAGRTYRLRIERNRSSKKVRLLLDGATVTTFTDTGGLAVFDDRAAYFFVDDTVTNGEESGGTVSRIRVWGDAQPHDSK